MFRGWLIFKLFSTFKMKVGVTKAMLSCLWDGASKRTVAANRKE